MKYLTLSFIVVISMPAAFSIQSEYGFLLEPAESVSDASGEVLDFVLVDQQVMIVADITNALDHDQQFAYIVQVQDEQGVTVSLSWISGSLSPNQLLSPGVSWRPQDPGVYHATIFVWEALDNPSALSHTLELDIPVVLEAV